MKEIQLERQLEEKEKDYGILEERLEEEMDLIKEKYILEKEYLNTITELQSELEAKNKSINNLEQK